MPKALCSSLGTENLTSAALLFLSVPAVDGKGVFVCCWGRNEMGKAYFTSGSSYGYSLGIAPANQSTQFLMLGSSGGRQAFRGPTMLQALGLTMLPTHCVSLGTARSVSLSIFQLVKLAYKPFIKSKLNNCEAL